MEQIVKPQAGDILFVTGDTLVDLGIEFVSHGDVSHVAIFIGEDKLFEAQGGRTLGECDLSFYLNDDKVTRLEVWQDTTLTDEERGQIVEFAKSMTGVPYDYTVIPLEVLHFELGVKLDWYRNHKLDCSEFVNACGEKVGRKWSKVTHPAPSELKNGGVLKRKLILKDVTKKEDE